MKNSLDTLSGIREQLVEGFEHRHIDIEIELDMLGKYYLLVKESRCGYEDEVDITILDSNEEEMYSGSTFINDSFNH